MTNAIFDVLSRHLHEADDHDSTHDQRVFWGVNAFLLALLILVCSWCWCCGGKERLLRHRRNDSDQFYRQSVLARQERRAESASRESPAKRKRKLIESFQRCQVKMVVQAEDLVDQSQHDNLDLSDSINVADAATQQQQMMEEGVLPVARTGKAGNDGDASNASMGQMEKQISVGTTKGDPDLEADDKEGDATDASPELQMEEGAPAAAEENDDGEAGFDEGDATDGDDAMDSMEEAIPDDTFDDSDASDDNNNGYLVLRHPAHKARRVPNSCAICLGSYQVGETVVWSSNPDCLHAFHADCMLDWLTKMRDGTPCPCCRQNFTDLVAFRKERKVTWRAGSTFDPQIIRLR